MGVKRVAKKFLKYSAITLLVLLIIPMTGKYKQQRSLDSFRGGTVRCGIALGDFDQLPKGYLTGFNYELLKEFGESHCDSISIFLVPDEASPADSLLLLDSLDILVVPSGRLGQEDRLTTLFPSDSSVAWVLKPDPYRDHEIIRWFNYFRATPEYSDLLQRFFFCYNPYRRARNPSVISPYDELLKKYSKTIGWDWRLLAAMVWSESMFKIGVHSPRGAVGLMQMMPATARRFGVENMLDPEENISAGARYLGMLQRFFSSYTDDPQVLERLTIASYNCGEGRTLEDLDGREQSAETAAYIRSVLNQYDIFRGVEPRYQEVSDTTAAPLLGPDGQGGIDPGDEHAGDEEQEHDDQE